MMSTGGALGAIRLSSIDFAPYGDVIETTADGTPFGHHDAVLELDRGAPRFYIMRLTRRLPTFDRITRHCSVTQCLASVYGQRWFLAVCPPDDVDRAGAQPDLSRLAAFEISGPVAVKLHRGTWHAGPFFFGDEQSFFNLELTETNVVDHHSAQVGNWRIAGADEPNSA